MPGMNSGVDINDPTVVSAFKQALAHQAIAAALLLLLLVLTWVTVRELRSPGPQAAQDQARPRPREAPARRVLRIGFGLLWVLDGILQAQPGMAVGLPSQVVQPTAESSPAWVQHLVNWAGTSWSYHPIQAAAGAVWIEVGLGLWLLLASQGRLSQLAGAASAGWGLLVWVFGESFGGIFAPGLSWPTGAPGAALCYCAAGALVALPGRYWQSARTGRAVLAGYGAFLVAMAVLQAWPGRGFWQGDVHGQPGTLTAAVQSAATLSQPDALASLVSGFASLVRAHGFAVNLIAVIALGATGLAIATARPRLVRPALAALAVLALADWLLVQDLGFFGGLGTSPGSMIPMGLIAAAGYLALTRAEPAPAPAAETDKPVAPSRRLRLRPVSAVGMLAAAPLGSVVSAGAIGVVLLGAVPMAAAQASTSASVILAQSVGGSSAPLDSPAPDFSLVDQDGAQTSLGSLHGKAVLLTFLDPVCVTDCPLIAQEFKAAGTLLGSRSGHVALVAVNLNPLYRDVRYLQAFDRQEGLQNVPGWLYLTGTPQQLQPVWKAYGQASETLPAGAMLGHSDTAFVIGPDGQLREEFDFDPGPGTTATESSFATELADAAVRALGPS